MRVIEVNPYEYWTSEADAEGYWHEANTLPVDEWYCSECPQPVGYHTYDNGESTTLDWLMLYIPVGSDPVPQDAVRFCEDCAQQHEVIET